MTQKITPPSATTLLNAAIDETKTANDLEEALHMLYQINQDHPESLAAMWYRNNKGRSNQEHKLENKLPKVILKREREKDIHQARIAWKICTPERILQEIRKHDPQTKYTLDLGKDALLELLCEILADKAKKLKKERK